MKRIFVLMVFLVLGTFVFSEAVESDSTKPMVKQPWDGDTEISGFGIPDAEILVSVNGIPFHQTPDEVKVDANGNFSVQLKNALIKGQMAKVEQVPANRAGGIAYIRVMGLGITEPLYEGQKEISGYLEKGLYDKGLTNKDIFVFIDENEKTEEKKEIEKNYDNTAGELQLLLKDELRAYQKVQIKVNEKKYAAVVKEAPLKIKQPLIEGNKMIEGFVNIGWEFPKVDIKICSPAPHSSFEVIDMKKNLPVYNGTFAVNLEKPLAEGDIVKAVVIHQGEEIVSPGVTVKSAILDWGRIRSYFTVGAIISKKKDEFSKFDPYLDFMMNTHWRILKRKDKIGVISYVGARLTSKPGIEESDENPLLTNGSGTNNTGQAEENYTTSNRAAILHAGTFLPIALTEWSYQGKNILFIAPIVKYGFHTLQKANNGEETDILKGDNLFIFGSLGLRLGHFMMFHDEKNIAPRLISYFDATLGWSEDLGEIRDPSDPKFPDDPLRNLLILYIEGRLKVPKTPFILGVDVVYQINHSKEVPGDIRFTFGTRINVDSAMRKLFSKR